MHDLLLDAVLMVIALLVGVVLVYPLRSRARPIMDDRLVQLVVYRDQLEELEREQNMGLFTAEQVEYARAEISRRILSTMQRKSARPPRECAHRWTGIAMMVPFVLAVFLYITIGRPELFWHPAGRVSAGRLGENLTSVIENGERLVAKDPGDAEAWEILGSVYLKTNRIGDAELAYRNVIRLLGPSAERLGDLGEVLVMKADGVVTAEARATLQQSLALDADNPRALFYLALALEQGGKAAEAKTAFEALAKQSPADAPWMAAVNDHIAKNGGTADMAAAGSANANAPGNPSAEQVAAADAMNNGDRQQMIRGMVESLDAKLKEDPRNFEGWMRLIRSYAVLNDKDRAVDALKRGLKTFPADGGEGQQLLALAKELGLPTEVTQQ